MKWHVNPSANVMSLPSADGTTTWQVMLYTRRRGQRIIELSAHVAHALLHTRNAEMPPGVLDAETLEFLRDTEVLVTQPVAPRPLYDCLLDLGDEAAASDDQLCLDPCFAVRGNPYSGLWLEEFAPMGHLMARYRIGPKILEGFVASLRGEVSAVDRDVRAALVRVGCLAQPSVIDSRRLGRQAAFEHARNEYAELDRTILHELVSAQELISLRQYCGEFLARGYIDGKFNEGGRRWSFMLSDPELDWLLRRTAPLVSDVAGEQFLPYYSFLVFYHEGGSLPLHRDRDGCHLSISLAIDAEPPELLDQWQLTLHYPSRPPESMVWRGGDGLLFDGIAVKHERPPLPEGGRATYLLLHYVAQRRAPTDNAAQGLLRHEGGMS